MASKRPFCDADFLCPICRDFFDHPVVLPCGHSGCKNCIEQYWRVSVSRQCPLCRQISGNNPSLNLVLRNLCQAFLDHRRYLEELCEVHHEERTVVCCDDEQLLCAICRECEEHRNHTCRPVQEIAEEHKGVLRGKLDFLKKQMSRMRGAHFEYDYTEMKICDEATHLEKQIKASFKSLRQLLDDEENAMLNELKLEKEKKMENLKDKREKIDEEIGKVTTTIKDLERELNSGNIRIIQNFKDTMMRAQCEFQGPERTPGELIDSAKYVGNLNLNVWRKVRRSVSYSPVVLDPNTANLDLIVSTDLRSVRFHYDDCYDKFPNNLERFDHCPCVLGSVGFSTGTHTWAVEVEDNTSWMVGVATESVQRKGTNGLPSGVWCIGHEGENLSVTDPLESHVPLLGFEKPAIVRVKLDMSAGQLSFSDRLCETVYHTFTHNFTEMVFPFFYTESPFSITILHEVKPEEI
ncbi:hypothetical protein R3I94_022940 [Phoxinus phoxinus]